MADTFEREGPGSLEPGTKGSCCDLSICKNDLDSLTSKHVLLVVYTSGKLPALLEIPIRSIEYPCILSL